MKRAVLLTAVLATSLALGCRSMDTRADDSSTTAPAAAQGADAVSFPAHYGEPMKLEPAQTMALADALAHPDALAGKYVRLEGKVTNVCAKRGCWIQMADPHGGGDLFVKFNCPIEGRLIPMEAVGRKVVTEGTLIVETISEEEARHYAQDAGKTAAEIASIKGEQKRLRLMAPAADIE